MEAEGGEVEINVEGKMRNRALFINLVILWALALVLIGAFLSVRFFVISPDPFDPWRMRSVDMLWASCIVLLLSAGIARIGR